jgi:exopolysaccharide biosynthesis polyprenyl glycosylphosphotransferase
LKEKALQKFFFTKHKRHQWTFLLGDLLMIVLALALALALTVRISFPGGELQWQGLSYGILLACSMFSFFLVGLYELSSPSLTVQFSKICLALAGNIIFLGALAYLVPHFRLGRKLLIFYSLFSFILVVAWRLLARNFIMFQPNRILFIGRDKLIDDLIDILTKKMKQYYKIIAHWDLEKMPSILKDSEKINLMKDVNMIVYSQEAHYSADVARILIEMSLNGINTYDAPSFYILITGKLPVYHLNHHWILSIIKREFIVNSFVGKIKRTFDLLFVLLCLPWALPLILLCGLLVKLDSRGPAFLLQERLGQWRVPFQLMKLRTMVDNAEKKRGPIWCGEKDPRITRVGNILRKTRLDEMPQLLNVLKGDMSLVGPRPIRKHFADLLAKEIPYYDLRFLAKPGLTGWAQINYNYAGSFREQAEKLQYDLFYVIHNSLLLDLFIIIKTVRVVLLSKGT